MGLLRGARPLGLPASELPAGKLHLERVAMQPEHPRGLADVAADFFQHALDDDPLEAIARLVEVHAQRLGRLPRSRASGGERHVERQIGGVAEPPPPRGRPGPVRRPPPPPPAPPRPTSPPPPPPPPPA